MLARMGVSMMPGDTQFTLTGANSSAKLRASDSSAPFAAPTIAAAGRGRMLRKPDTSVSEPPARISAACATRQAPQNLPHGGAHVVHGHCLEGAGLELRGGDNDVIDRAAFAEKIGYALIAGDVGRNRRRAQFICNHLQAVGVTGGNDNIGAFTLCQLGGRKTDAGRAPNDDNLHTCEQHTISSNLGL